MSPTIFACDEKVIIDSVEYSVAQQWCGKMIDSTKLADKQKLVRIPDEYCFENYRIYLDINARDAFMKMAKAAEKDSINLMVKSGFRSRQYQAEIISRRLAEGYTFEQVIKYIAPPGYSEHETGRVADLVSLDTAFAFSEVYKWLVENAHKYGFVESLPNDTTSFMPWEPWHWAYSP